MFAHSVDAQPPQGGAAHGVAVRIYSLLVDRPQDHGRMQCKARIGVVQIVPVTSQPHQSPSETVDPGADRGKFTQA